MLALAAHNTMLMHIDVQARCAHKFGRHFDGIIDFIKAGRAAGAAVTGVLLDEKHPGRPLGVNEVIGDYNKRDSADDRFGMLVPPVNGDRFFSKQGPSILQGVQGAAVRHHVAHAIERGVTAVAVAGYYADQCVRLSVVALADEFPELTFYVVDDLCRAEREPYSMRHQFAGMRNVKVVDSTGIRIVSAHPAPAQTRRRSTVPPSPPNRPPFARLRPPTVAG